jgi:bifunctional non-homologous end joining protein LigD
MLSKNGNPLSRYRSLLDALPHGYVFDGEICALDGEGRPVFLDLLFHRRQPTYVAFDVLIADGEDIRGQALKERRVILDRLACSMTFKNRHYFGCGKSLFNVVCKFDLEGIVAKRLTDAYEPGRTKWWAEL